MDKKLEEQVIYPKDLLFAALYRWKVALVLGLVLAVLLGGFQLRGAAPVAVDAGAMAAYEEAMEEYEAKKAVLDKYLEDFEYELETEQTHLQESVYLNLDPYHHYRGTLHLYVHTDYQIQPDKAFQTPDQTAYLLSNYFTLLHNDNAIETVGKAVGLTWRQTFELYKVSYDSSIHMLTATVKGADKETVQQMLDEVMALVDAATVKLNDTIGAHEVRVVHSGIDPVTDTNISADIRNAWDHINFLKEQIGKVNDELANLPAPAQPVAAGGVSLKKVVIFAALGFIAGVAVVAVCAWFGHMESNKVYSARLLSLRTGAKVLGTLTVTDFNCIDKRIRKWEGRDTADPESKAMLLACDLRNRFPQGKLLLTGSGKAEERALLLKALKEAGVDAEDAGSILQEPAAVDALKRADGVVLAEACGRAVCQDVLRQMQAVTDYEKQLLGCVVLNG